MKSEKLKVESEKPNLKCPDCNNSLKEVLADTYYGLKIKLNQCSDCGGIWFDDPELYPIKKEEIEKLENVDLKKLRENSFLGNGKKICPKCEIELENFKDYNFPRELEAEYCKKCRGIWMNRGEATDFKMWQEEKKKSLANVSEKDEEFCGKIKDMLEVYRGNDFKNIGNIGKMLSLRIDPVSGRPLNKSDYWSEEYSKASQAVSTAVVIIYMLLRLFLRR